MPLIVGTMLGPYEVLANVGVGGMGEVYRARDTRLDRIVAIKVMTPDFGPVDTMGLQREARAVAALNHPHICALHDVGFDKDTPFLVMEYVAGETLAAKLRSGPLPTRDVLRYGIQIAEALDHAHRRGVIHRDLKPANIMLTASGVKVLDFGLAVLRAGTPVQAASGFDRRGSTAKVTLASERTLCGTVHYMAPERLEGCEADTASDIFAFGAVMFEMATGQRAFESSSPAGVIAAILHADTPAASSLQPQLPAGIDWVIRKCLARSPEARWQAAGDIVEVLRWLARGSQPAPAPARSSAPRWMRPVIVGAVVALGGLALMAVREVRRTPIDPAPLTFSIPPPPGGGFTPTPSSVPTPQFALSPNGEHLMFVAAAAGDVSQIWIRPLNSLRAEAVPATQGAAYPFWSPDGASIAFFAHGVLRRVDLAGGPARVLAAAPNGRGGAWNRDGVILFAPTTQGGLFRVASTGGQVMQVTTPDGSRQEASHRWPQFLPDGKKFLYFVQSASAETQGIYEGDLESPPRHKVLASALSAQYVPPDRLLFVVDDELMATGFDWQQHRAIGQPFRIASPVSGSSNFYAAFSASETGLLSYASVAATFELVWTDRVGHRTGSVGPIGEYVDFRLGRHDRDLALAEVDAQSHRPDIRVLDLARGTKIRLTYDAATDASPIWSPDGQRLVFRSNRAGVHDLYAMSANGAAPAALVLQNKTAKYPTDWTPDGRGIVYHAYRPGTGSDIWMMNADGSAPRPLVQTAFDEMQGQLSSDGRWLAYTSVESGAAEVYVRSFSDVNSRWQVSAGGGVDPRWRGDAQELFYVSADSWMTAVAFVNGVPSAPRRLFQVYLAPAGNPYLSNYNVTADGQRFLLKVPVHDVTSTPINLLTNWLAPMKRSAP